MSHFASVVVGAEDLDEASRAIDLARRLHDPGQVDITVRPTRFAADPDVLCDVAEEQGADLIVVGDHGVAQHLAHAAPCALAVAPAASAATGAVCIAYDGSPEADLALAVGYALAARWATDVLLCHVFEPGRLVNRVPRLDSAASHAPLGVDVWEELVEGIAGPAILRAAGADAAIIVAGSSHLGTRGLFAGSVSGHLLAHADVPVLVTPHAGRFKIGNSPRRVRGGSRMAAGDSARSVAS